jgi:hypothetical protein
MSALCQKRTHAVQQFGRFTPQKRTLELSRVMSALCQKQTLLPAVPP